MKEQVQQEGVRKWFGDDWISLQDELMAALEAHFGHFKKQFILNGCEINATTVNSGIVVLEYEGGYKLCRFNGATGVTFPSYLKPETQEETGQTHLKHLVFYLPEYQLNSLFFSR